MKRIATVLVVVLVLGLLVWCFSLRQQPSEVTTPRPPAAQVPSKKEPSVSPAVTIPDRAQPSANAAGPAVPFPAPAATVPAGPLSVITGEIEAERDVFKEPFIKRSRPIAISPQILEQNGPLEIGSKLSLALFTDAVYTVTLQQVDRAQGALSMNGRLEGEEYGTFSMSAASGVVVGQLKDPEALKLFLIRCHGPTRTHYAVEVDLEKVPVPKTSSRIEATDKP